MVDTSHFAEVGEDEQPATLRGLPSSSTAPRRGKGDGGLHQRNSDGYWEATLVTYVNGRRRRQTFRGRTKSEAVAKRRKAETDQARGNPVSSTRMTVATLCNQWFDLKLKTRVELGDLKAKTEQNYRSVYSAYVMPILGDQTIRNLRTADIDAMSRKMRSAGLAQNTVRLARTVLRMALDYGVSEGLIVTNPVGGSAKPNVASSVDDHTTLSVKQARYLFTRTTKDPYGPFVGVALWTGMREGELVALLWKDVDLKAKRLVVTGTIGRIAGQGLVRTDPKTKASKAPIPLPEPVVQLLRRQSRLQKDQRRIAGEFWIDSGLVFTNALGGPIDPRFVLKQWRRIQATLKLPDMTFHDLRHTTATLLLNSGVSLEVVSAVLRHASIRVTKDFYAKVEEPLMRKGMDSFERVLG